MKKFIKSISLNFFKEQSGVAMVLIALCMFIFAGFAAIVVDAGGLYVEKSRLQKALDAAVLAGAQELKVSSEAAKDAAKGSAIYVADKNGFTISDMVDKDGIGEVKVNDYTVTIKKTVNKDLTFARVLGFDNADVGAYAKAELITTLNRTNAVPVVLKKTDLMGVTLGHLVQINQLSPTSGNFGFLNNGGHGGGKPNLVKGIDEGIAINIDDYFLTETGNRMKNKDVVKSFEDRLTADSNKAKCKDVLTADKTCRSLITVAIINEFPSGQSTPQKIIGLASFLIDSVEKGKLMGRFIETFTDGNSTIIGGRETFKVKLIN